VAFECSYAGIGLCVPTPEVQAWVDRYISLVDLRDVQPPARWPGKNLRGAAWDDPADYPSPRVGQLFWPAGASRYAVGRFLATGEQVKQIKNKVLAVGPNLDGRPLAQKLILQADTGQVGTYLLELRMHLLPPRPLGGLILDLEQTDTGKDLYLLTLVDERYYWHFAGADWQPDWGKLIARTAQALGFDTLSPLGGFGAFVPGQPDPFAPYGVPESDSALFVNSENAAVVLDAALANIGHVLVGGVGWEGAVYTGSPVRQAARAVAAAHATWAKGRVAGGVILGQDPTVPDQLRNLVFPYKVVVTFPKWIDTFGYYRPRSHQDMWGRDSYESVWSSEVFTNALPGYGSVKTTPYRIKIFHDTAKARWPPPTDPNADPAPATTDPSNAAALNALVRVLAIDYLDGLAGRIDEVYAGIVPAAGDGLNDATFVYRTDACFTRLQGRPFNAGVGEFQHGLEILTVCAQPPAGSCEWACTYDIVQSRPAAEGGCEFQRTRLYFDRPVRSCSGGWTPQNPPPTF
jgi:hypothetical protein